MTEKEDSDPERTDQPTQEKKVTDPAVEWMPKMTRSEYAADMRRAASAALKKAGLVPKAATEKKKQSSNGSGSDNELVTLTRGELNKLKRKAEDELEEEFVRMRNNEPADWRAAIPRIVTSGWDDEPVPQQE